MEIHQANHRICLEDSRDREMTLIIEHRKNTLQECVRVSPFNGAEIDLRGHNGRIVLAHDFGEVGCEFKEWLDSFKGEFLVINIKEMGIEDGVHDLLSERNLTNSYFFLDLVTPSLVLSLRKGYVCAARVSEYECLSDALNTGAEWIWIDSFSGEWSHLKEIADMNLRRKVCIVSPELQGRGLKENTREFEILSKDLIDGRFDAICTKYPQYWREKLGD